MEKNCAYALQCGVADGHHRIEVIKLQEPTAPDARTLLTPLPPPHGRQVGQRAAVRQQSRLALARPRAIVEAAIVRRMQSEEELPPPIVTPMLQPHRLPSAPPPTNGTTSDDLRTLDRYEPL